MPALPYSLNGANTRLVDDQYVSPLRLKDIEIKGIMNATGRRIGHPQVGISWCLLNHGRDCPAVISSSRLNLSGFPVPSVLSLHGKPREIVVRRVY